MTTIERAFLAGALALVGAACLQGEGLAAGAVERAEAQRRVLGELETSFQRDLQSVWYPKIVDTKRGGYLTDLDARWRPVGAQDKFLVAQARHLWVTSQLAAFTGEARYLKMARHGFDFLRREMWDARHGGFHLHVTRAGRPMPRRGKSAYGMSFALYGLSAYYAASGDAAALALAQDAFDWMETRSWDHEYGGYVDRLRADGSWAGESEEQRSTDPGQHIGLKDYNSSIHLLECLTALYQVWPDERVEQRLGDMLELVRDRFVTERGYLQLYFFRDWTPVTFRGMERSFILANNEYDHVSWGHDVETAFLMLEASHALGLEEDERTLAVAKRLVDHALATGWDADGGGWPDGGYYFSEEGSCEVIRPSKVWWTAAEGLNALLLMSQLFPEEERYFEAFLLQWEYIKENLLDEEYGGWLSEGLDTDPDAGGRRKAHAWKASYHDGRTYMNCIRMLRGTFELTGGH